ncbi:hypothetical protein THASP1DRAFT_5099, partial [Thamnocephalis sphaerospora]
RAIYEPHLTKDQVAAALRAGNLIQGRLRINKHNRSEAYVTLEGQEGNDIYINSQQRRNRALDGDLVAVELLNRKELAKARSSKQDADRAKRKLHGRPEPTKEEKEEAAARNEPAGWGKVVAIVEMGRSREVVGTLYLNRPHTTQKTNTDTDAKDQRESNGKQPVDAKLQKKRLPRQLWFKPTDNRVPFMLISRDTVPERYLEDADAWETTLYTARLKNWSTHSTFPLGEITARVGPIGQIEVETKAILADCNVSSEPFTDSVLACLPKTPWSIREADMRERFDMRNECVFTIDPPTARDLDDAVSCVEMPDGNYSIGVHIADVSHFVQPNTALDKEAQRRGTTTYLVQRAVPMLPSLLCEELCSLNPGVDRLAFSVIWKMTPDARILDTWFGSTVIRSCCKLAYDDAQEVIEGRSLPEHVTISEHNRDDVEKRIRVFFELSRILRKRRFDNGAVSINSIRLSFVLDDEGLPLECKVYQQKESNRLIEEFMLLANMSVAKKIAVSFPEHALLRRHAPPLQRRMDEFIRLTEKLGYPIDGTSGATLHASFQQIDDPRIAEVLKVLAIKPMQRAKYYCTGSLDITQYHHFALNAPLYTHFTSPIRRYADVIVHRLLLSALKGGKWACDIALRCNTCKEQAKSAQEQSSHLYLATCLHRLITQRGGPIRTEAVIIDVMDQSVRLLSPEYGIEQRVYIDKLPLERSTWDEQRGQHTVHWRDNVTIADVLTTSAQANEESESESDTENEEEEELH